MEDAQEALLDVCTTDPELRLVVDRYSATQEDLRGLHMRLLAAGAAQWVGAHYVPVAALTNVHTLDYLLSHFAGEAADHADVLAVAVRVMEYFGQGESGPLL